MDTIAGGYLKVNVYVTVAGLYSIFVASLQFTESVRTTAYDLPTATDNKTVTTVAAQFGNIYRDWVID